MRITASEPAINAICPYFTMFPFAFPQSVVAEHSYGESSVLDPFCGRGTTNLAGRLAGLPTIGIDSNPVAVAIAKAKLIHASPDSIVASALNILQSDLQPTKTPHGEFWSLAFSKRVLNQLCQLREALLEDGDSPDRIALRAILLGALHGPRNKGAPSYFSNQSPRTFAPKPDYAVRFWRERDLAPPDVDVIELIRRRANRYFGETLPEVEGRIILDDSRDPTVFDNIDKHIGLIVTSPPYYGMRTYIPDQWLRWWFLGGPDTVDYSNRNQIRHRSPSAFAAELGAVWRNVATITRLDATLVIRFGAINDRKVDPRELIELSLNDTGWRIASIASAGSAARGKRQADHFTRKRANALEEFDVVALRT